MARGLEAMGPGARRPAHPGPAVRAQRGTAAAGDEQPSLGVSLDTIAAALATKAARCRHGCDDPEEVSRWLARRLDGFASLERTVADSSPRLQRSLDKARGPAPADRRTPTP